MFYPYSITINKCKGSCNTIDDPYAKLCVSDRVLNRISEYTYFYISKNTFVAFF